MIAQATTVTIDGRRSGHPATRPGRCDRLAHRPRGAARATAENAQRVTIDASRASSAPVAFEAIDPTLSPTAMLKYLDHHQRLFDCGTC